MKTPLKVRARWCTTCLAGLLLLTLTGCQKNDADPSKLLQVTGKILWDGKPYGGAEVTFVPQRGGGISSTGLADPSGSFTIDGVLPGDYQVRVIRVSEDASIEPELEVYTGQESPLTASVQPEQTEFQFDLGASSDK